MRANIEVSKEAFEEFLANYPNKLKYDWCGFFEPPVESYNDYSLGMWPESVVAWKINNWLKGNDVYEYYLKGEEDSDDQEGNP